MCLWQKDLNPYEVNKIVAFGYRYSGLACLSIIIVFFLVGLWPLDFSPKNQVEWLKEGGLRFIGSDMSSRYSAGGIAYSPDPVIVADKSLEHDGAVTIELALRCATELHGGVQRILSIADEAKEEMLAVGQWRSHLIIRKFLSKDRRKRLWREIGISKALPKGKVQFLTISSCEQGTGLFLNGNLAKFYKGISLFEGSRGTPKWHVFLGNSPDGTQSWSGELLGLGIYSRALSAGEAAQHSKEWEQESFISTVDREGLVALYDFAKRDGEWSRNMVGRDNPLRVPLRFQFEKRVLGPFSMAQFKKGSGFKDIMINILGFVPFGFFCAFWSTRFKGWGNTRVYLTVIAIGFFVSLAIELSQAFLPARDSSQLDLICNTLGTAFGVLFFHGFRQKERECLP